MASCLTPLPLSKESARGIHYQNYYTLLQLRYLPISLIRISKVQLGDHEIKIVNLTTPPFS